MFKSKKMLALILLSTFTLTGCLTSKLNEASKEKLKLSYDTVNGFTMAKNKSNQDGVVFIGEYYDYFIEDITPLIRTIQTYNIPAKNIELANDRQFELTEDQKFSGEMLVTFNIPENKCSSLANDLDESITWIRDPNCKIYIPFKRGTIHQKLESKSYKDHYIPLSKFKITFWKKEGRNNAYSVLYPFAIAADIITTPIILVGAAPILISPPVAYH